jgi:hypothetical protein
MYKSHDGTEVAVVAATWELNPKVTFASLAPEFKSNPVKAWRNFGSVVGAGGGSPALKDPRTMELHVNHRRTDPWDPVRERFYEDFRGRRLARYFIHLDLAKNKDAAGIACVHREPTGIMVVDFMHQHPAKPGTNIQFAELREKYIYALHSRNFKIEMVTFDQWNSEESRQILEGQGYQTDQVSADKTGAPYDTLIELILNDRLDYYQHEVFMREMQRLQTNGLKYDHLKNGSKDVADAVACACFAAIQYELDNPVEKGLIRVNRSPRTAQRFKPRYERSVW